MPEQIKAGIKPIPPSPPRSVTHYISDCSKCGEMTKWTIEELRLKPHSKVRGCPPYPYDVQCPNCGQKIMAEPRWD